MHNNNNNNDVSNDVSHDGSASSASAGLTNCKSDPAEENHTVRSSGCHSSNDLLEHEPSTTTTTTTAATAASLTLAGKDYEEHMGGMQELFETMRQRPLRLRAHPIGEEEPQTASHNGQGRHIKTLHLVRHGQGFHNLLADVFLSLGQTWTQFQASSSNPYTLVELLDAPLTEKGRNQALQLQSRVQQLSIPPQLVVSSPHCRALQTAMLAFESRLPPKDERTVFVSDPVKKNSDEAAMTSFVAHELVREETGIHLCDQRRRTSRQRCEFPQFQFLTTSSTSTTSTSSKEEHNHHQETTMQEHDVLFHAHQQQRETKLQLGERIYQFLEWLEQRPETHVAISTHSAWLLTLMNGICDCSDHKSLQTWFHTGEMRSIQLEFVRRTATT